jgi:uncharacterized protein (DUF2141 family)
MVGSKPAINQLNFKGKKIEVIFDEFINIDNPSENVIVTPPQKQSPVIQTVGKKVNVELKDTLKENTTYTIDFTGSISDNNEKNVLENFAFAFSTGDELDTLQISGTLYDARDLEPVPKVMVGIHSDLSDTAFTTTPFLRTSKTDERGRFVIHNIKPGNYHLFALEDKNRNYAYDKNNDEALAFFDSIITPTCERKIVADSIWKDTIINKIDTIIFDSIAMVEKTLFYPNDLKLRYFRDSITPRQRMMRPERPQPYIFTLKFNAPLDTFPYPTPLNFDVPDSSWFITQRAEDPESFAINYWLLDSTIYKLDTLTVEISYWKNNDSVPDLMELQIDTLEIFNREATAEKKKKERTKKKPVRVRKSEGSGDSLQRDSAPPLPPPVPLQMNITPSGALNPYDVITIGFGEPTFEVSKELFRFESAIDTLWELADFEFEKDSLRAMTYIIRRPFHYDERYRLTVDSALLTGVYGHSNNSVSIEFKVKSEKEYGHLSIDVRGLPRLEGDSSGAVVPAFMELLSANGSPVRTAPVENGKAVFRDMNAEKYYARLTYDINGNGQWDAGNYENRQQPEMVIYCMQQFEIRQNWKIEETWDVSNSRTGEKPQELLKNKPKEEKRKRRNYREESNSRRSSGTGSSMPNIGGMIGR